MAWLGAWANREAIVIDNANIDNDLTHFPVALNLGESVGKESQDLSGVFDALDYGSVDDDFSGNDGDAPESDLWDALDTDSMEIHDNKLQMESADQASVKSKYYISGEFDIEVFLDISNAPAIGSWTMGLCVHFGDDLIRMSRRYDTVHKYLSDRYISGSWSTVSSEVTTDTQCGFRIKRAGTTLYYYYRQEGSWQFLGVNNNVTADVKISIEQQTWDSFPAVIGGFFDFKVNSGTIIWPENTFPNRKKIAITKSDGITQLYGEIETWDHANKKAVIWFSKSDFTISSSTKTQIYLYYDKLQSDNTAYIGDTGDTVAKNVWDSNFVSVYHMAQDPSGGADCILDSTTNENHGTPTGSMTTSDLVDGGIGKAIDFDGEDDLIDCEILTFFDGASSLCVEAFSSITSVTGIEQFIRFDDLIAFGTGWYATPEQEQYLTMYYNSSGSWTPHYGVTDIRGEGWKYTCARLDSGISYISVDGEVEGSQNQNVPLSSPSNSHLQLAGGLTGKISEIRLSNNARTTEWIKATNKALNDSLLFFGSLFSGTITADGEGVSREINFYKEPDLSMSIGSVTSETDGTWEIVLDVASGDYVTAVCEGEESEQSQVFNKISAE